MQKETKLNILGQLLLLSATIVWGSSFVILKRTIETVPMFYILGVRFLSSAVIIGIIFFKKVFKMGWATFWRGSVLGLVVALAYLFQTLGLQYTTPGINAFLTSLYCILTPFFAWLIFKKKPKIYNVIAAITCIIGVGLISLSGDSGKGNGFLGEGLTIVCAVFYCFQILLIDRFKEEKRDTISILVTELLIVGIFFFILSFIFELPTKGIGAYALDTDSFLKILYLTLACTLFAQIAQIFGQKFSNSPTQASVILCLESVFGTFFSVVMGEEVLTAMIIVGFSVIFIGMLISELKADPIALFKKMKRREKVSERYIEGEEKNNND